MVHDSWTMFLLINSLVSKERKMEKTRHLEPKKKIRITIRDPYFKISLFCNDPQQRDSRLGDLRVQHVVDSRGVRGPVQAPGELGRRLGAPTRGRPEVRTLGQRLAPAHRQPALPAHGRGRAERHRQAPAHGHTRAVSTLTA